MVLLQLTHTRTSCHRSSYSACPYWLLRSRGSFEIDNRVPCGGLRVIDPFSRGPLPRSSARLFLALCCSPVRMPSFALLPIFCVVGVFILPPSHYRVRVHRRPLPNFPNLVRYCVLNLAIPCLGSQLAWHILFGGMVSEEPENMSFHQLPLLAYRVGCGLPFVKLRARGGTLQVLCRLWTRVEVVQQSACSALRSWRM
jgi:hypothetical protein